MATPIFQSVVDMSALFKILMKGLDRVSEGSQSASEFPQLSVEFYGQVH